MFTPLLMLLITSVSCYVLPYLELCVFYLGCFGNFALTLIYSCPFLSFLFFFFLSRLFLFVNYLNAGVFGHFVLHIFFYWVCFGHFLPPSFALLHLELCSSLFLRFAYFFFSSPLTSRLTCFGYCVFIIPHIILCV